MVSESEDASEESDETLEESEPEPSAIPPAVSHYFIYKSMLRNGNPVLSVLSSDVASRD